VVVGRDRCGPAVDEGAVHRPEIDEDPVAVAIEPICRRGGEDRVTLELDEGEVGLDPPDDRVEQGREDRVRRRDACAEIEPMLLELEPPKRTG